MTTGRHGSRPAGLAALATTRCPAFALGDARLLAELTELERQIDRVALAAFDVFVQCREQVYELRVNEVKRRVSWVVNRMNGRGLDPELARTDLE